VAEDLTQEVMLLLEEKYRDVDRLDDLLPLSVRILRFKMAGLRRKSWRRGEYTAVDVETVALADPRPDPAAAAERQEMVERLSQALAKMGGRCREMFRLKLEGRTFEEIRQLMKAGSLNTVYTWDHRCRKQLLELMGGRYESRRD
jgi:RNA polymerase sigma-70 factor (ECF subfamily)